jgi:hypothetical protein
MRRDPKWLIAVTIAAIFAFALMFMTTRHTEAASPAAAPVHAEVLPPAPMSVDEANLREAQRELGANPSLSGCVLRVSSENGVLFVTGRVQHELQIEAARSALRGVRSAREVHVDVRKF